MRRKLIIFGLLVVLCIGVYAKNHPMSAEQTYLICKAKEDSIQTFHETKYAEANQKKAGAVFQGAISGTVYESDGTTPISDAAVIVWNTSWTVGYWFYTDHLGRYIGNVYEGGTYYVTASGYVMYVGYLYDEEFYNESSKKSGADPVTVTSPDTTTGINFTLTRRGAVSGTVYEDDGVTPIQDTWIDLLNLSGECLGGASTNSDGLYTITCVSTGNYVVRANGYVVGMGELYTTEYYDNKGSLASADQVSVTSPNTTIGINFALTRGGYLLNTMTDPYWAGNISKDPEKWLYAPGDVVTLGMSFVYPGYQFDHWTGDVTGTDTTVQITMNSDKNVTAHLIPEPPPGIYLNVTVNPAGAGEVSKNPDKDTYDYMEIVSLNAIPGEEWIFRQWSQDKEGTNDPDTVIMNRNKYVTANFGHILETETYPEDVGSISLDPDIDIFEHNQIVQVLAHTPEGYSFAYWDGDLEGSNNPGNITMDSNKKVIARFQCNQRTLIMQIYPEECGTTIPEPGEYTYENGDTVYISAIPAEGYKFCMWKCSVADPYNPNTYVVMNTNETVTAEFELIPQKVTLTMQVDPLEGGTTQPEPGSHKYIKNQVVSLTAIPEQGYRFVQWLGSVADAYDSTTTITMSKNKTVKALFECIYVKLNMCVDPEQGGTTEPAPGIHTYERGDTVDISAIPSPGYEFVRWKCDVLDPDNRNTTVVMDVSDTVTAVFELKQFLLTIKVKPEEAGETEPAVGIHDYNYGEVVDIYAEPEYGYRFVGWSGTVADSDSVHTTVTMDSNKTVQANFEKIQYSLNILVDPEGSGKTEPKAGVCKHNAGDTVYVSAVQEKKKFRFSYWSGDVQEPDSTNTCVVMNSNKTVTAHFLLADDVAPFMKNCFPCPHTRSVPKNTKVKFWAKDHETGVDLSSLDAWINELQILDGGVNITDGHVTIVTGDKGYKVTYKTDDAFEEGSKVVVRAMFSDSALPPNQCDSSYTFEIGTAKVESVVSGIIGEEGGTLIDNQSGIQIDIPVNALEDSIEIIIDRVQDPPPLPEGFEGIATPYHFGPDGLQFNAGIAIQIPYTQDDLEEAGIKSPEDLRIFYFHVTPGEWIELEINSVDPVLKIVYVTVYEFCYLSFGREETTGIDHGKNLKTSVPTEFSLSQNYPNPFNPETCIQYAVPEPCHSVLEVYNMAGRLILTLVNEQKSAGIYEVTWHGKDEKGTPVSTGLYIFRFRAKDKIFIRKVFMLK